jgi:hypothetical protein
VLVATQTGSRDEELDTVLDRIMTLFRHLRAKDVFEAFYKKVRNARTQERGHKIMKGKKE